MPAHLIRARDLYPDAPYAYASVAPPGSLIFTAGACPIDEAGMVTDAGDYAAQAARAVANLVAALAAWSSLADVAKTTVYVASAAGATCLRYGRWCTLRSTRTNRRARCSES